MTKRIAVYGLGSMGYGIAQSLLRAGHTVAGFDINQAAVDAFQAEGGVADAPADFLPTADIVVVVVLNADQTRAVMLGEGGIAQSVVPGSCIISCATVPPSFAREMEAAARAKGLHYLDAPISGGAAKSALGQLSVMAAGTPEAFATARPALDGMAETVFELGSEAGPGSAMKAVNQLLAGVHIATMAEAVTFGMTQGVSPEQTLNVIRQCAGSSWMFENRAPHIVDADYTPRSAVNIWPKDLGIVLDIAGASDFEAPITKAALERFNEAARQGLGHEDDAAVAKVYARQAGLKLPGEAE
ncbi:MAG: NAD(P)-dependent oxidoreductase [Paracoccaceae bacterium]